MGDEMVGVRKGDAIYILHILKIKIKQCIDSNFPTNYGYFFRGSGTLRPHYMVAGFI